MGLHHGCDPHDKTVHAADEVYDMKHRSVPYPHDLLYVLPDAFREQRVDADGVRCFWASWPGTSTDDGVLVFLHGGAFITGTVSMSSCARPSDPPREVAAHCGERDLVW